MPPPPPLARIRRSSLSRLRRRIGALAAAASLVAIGGIGASPAVASAATGQPLTVLSASSFRDSAGNVHVVGEIRNPSRTVVGAPAITVTARGAGGAALATEPATSTLTALLPGELSGISAVFPPPAGFVSATVDGASAAPTSNTPDRRLRVSVTPGPNGAVSGTVANTDTAPARDVSVAFTFYDARGTVVDVESALVGTSGPNDIGAGANAPFTSSRPGGAPPATTVSAIAQAASQPTRPNPPSCPTLAALSTTPVSTGSGGFHALNPRRILDTRLGSGKPQAGHTLCGRSSIEVQVTGVGGVPSSGVSAVFLTVTAVGHTNSSTAVTAYPAGNPVPVASNLNLVGAGTRAQLVEVAVGAGGRIGLNSAAGEVDLIADVAGYVDDSGNAVTGSLITVPPTRAADTRPGSGTPDAGKTLGAGGSLPIKVTGMGGVPSGVPAVIANLTAVQPTGNTYLSVGDATTSNVNAPPRVTVADRVIAPVDGNGDIHVYNNLGRTDVVVDITGYVSTSAGDTITSVLPTRLADTRAGSGFQSAGAPLSSGGTLTVQVTGNGGVPQGATAALVTVTVTDTTSAGYAVAYATGAARPSVSDVNWVGPRATAPNLVLVRLSSSGAMTVYNRNGNADVIVDVDGYLTGG